MAPEHVGAIVVTGSHGGLLGGKPETALKYDALAALFNDAGIGIETVHFRLSPKLSLPSVTETVVTETVVHPESETRRRLKNG